MSEENVTVVDQVWSIANKTNTLVQNAVREIFNGKTTSGELILENSEGPDYKVTVRTTRVRAAKKVTKKKVAKVAKKTTTRRRRKVA